VVNASSRLALELTVIVAISHLHSPEHLVHGDAPIATLVVLAIVRCTHVQCMQKKMRGWTTRIMTHD
jgi:hypothetical protein